MDVKKTKAGVYSGIKLLKYQLSRASTPYFTQSKIKYFCSVMASPFLTPPPLSPPSYQQSYDNGSEGIIKNSKHFLNLSLESQTLRTKIKFFHLKGTVCAISSNPPHLCLIYLWLRYVCFCLFKLFIFIRGFSAKVTSAFLSIYKKQWSQTRMYLPHFDQLKVSKVRLWIEHCYLCMSLKITFLY